MASDMFRERFNSAEASNPYLPLLDVYTEGELLQEVKDISEELDIMLSITNRQNGLVQTFCQHVEDILVSDRQWKLESGPPVSATQANEGESRGDEERNRAARQTQLKWFRVQSQALLKKISVQTGELEALRDSAKSTEQSVCRDIDCWQE